MRSRNIKPGFFKNEDLAEIEPLGRLLFEGLWCMADREGRLEDRPKRIKIEVLPYDEISIDKLLEALLGKGFIFRYSVNGNKYIQLPNFHKHQDPHYKEAPSEIPPPEGHQDSLRISPSLTNSQKEAIYLRDGKKCRNCKATKNLTVDHIIPLSLGGTNNDSNLQVLCSSCNASKNNRVISSQLRPKVDPRSSLDSPLIPDSLIPDSLIPDSLNPLRPKVDPRSSLDSPLIPDSLIPSSLNPDSLNPLPASQQGCENGRDYSREFSEIFYPAYPRKVNRATAEKTYLSIGKKGKLPSIDLILAALEDQKTWPSWNKDNGEFIPYPSTWLNGRSWENQRPKIGRQPAPDGSRFPVTVINND